jgi:hypothetical protein
MVTELAAAHLTSQERLRTIIARAVAAAWTGLAGHDEDDVSPFISTVAPLVVAGQRQAVALTDAYLAASLGRAPLGLDPERLIGAAVRNGTAAEEVYRRPFVTVWTALSKGARYEDALNSGLARARSSASMDVQLSHRAAYAAAQVADPAIRGYQRIADASACDFCRTVNGAFVKSASAMPLHNGCGCGLGPLTRDVTPSVVPDTVVVHEHGELGPVLTDPAHHFTSLADLG